jgi:trehalose synthase
MPAEQVAAVLGAAGIAEPATTAAPAEFVRLRGDVAPVRHTAAMVEDTRIRPETQLVVQVSRWDRLKDPVGVVRGFHAGVTAHCDAHLLLAGPSVAEVADDPEGAEVLAEVTAEWRSLPPPVRARVHLAALPMDDDEENAAMVNAVQRRAAVVVQKSLAEGFGLTVAEAMWKGKPVIGGFAGGITVQIVFGTTGYTVNSVEGAAFRARYLLNNPALARQMGENGREYVRRNFLVTRHLMDYLALLTIHTAR